MALKFHQNTRYGAAIVAAALAITVSSVPAAAQPTPLASPDLPSSAFSGSDTYIVTLADKPLATYAGGVPGIAATKPGKGKKLDVDSANAQRYRNHLKDKHTKVARSVGAKAVKDFYVASNSFAAELTMAQAVRLRATEGVFSVEADKLYKPTNDRNSVDFLGLSGSTGLWSKLGGTPNAGKGVVVGVIDTGIWPESASFTAPAIGTARPTADDPYRPYRIGTHTVMQKADGTQFVGTCQAGEEFTENLCNEKIISARYFGEGWSKSVPPEQRKDYLSPRDAQGHGTHTASTAAGNTDVPVTERGIDFGKISGVAPGAAIAVYKALWQGTTDETTGGNGLDILAAIDQAVADNVDVINYSVGSTMESNPFDFNQMAFLNAAAAGIFVAASAGNSGPKPSSLDNTSPWVTTVGASTVASYPGSVQLGNGTVLNGISSTVPAAFGPKPLISSRAAKAAGATDQAADYCFADSLDPAKVAGKVVLCLRGINMRPEKSAEVARAGGVGMVLGNPADSSVDADLHNVPTVHINWPDTQTVQEYAATADAQVTLLPTGPDAVYPQVAPFSSRGPSTRNRALLKPDIAAPGVSILAAVAPPGNDGKNFDFYSGTSMAAPHVAGLAALVLGKNPLWSPAQIRSAMMTTAYPTLGANGEPSADVFAHGAGHVDPARMLNPGLFYDTTEREWLGYVQGVVPWFMDEHVPAIQGSDLNQPAILGDVVGTRTFTRKVTAVTPGTYRAKVDLPGYKVTVNPPTLSFKRAGETRLFDVTVTLDTAITGQTSAGSLTWTGAGTSARSPIVVTPQSVSAPTAVEGTGATGSLSFEVTPAVKKFPIKTYPFVAGPLERSAVRSDEDGKELPFTVPAGAKALELTVRADDPQAMLALIVARKTAIGWQLVYLPNTLGSEQRATIPSPVAGEYAATVISLITLPGTTETAFTMQTNMVTEKGGVGTLSVSPSNPKVTPGTPLTLTANWSGVPDGRHTGYIEYPNGIGTVVSIN